MLANIQPIAYAHYGIITKLERGKVAQHTWVSAGTKGLESVVTTTFGARDGGTFITLRHAGVPDDEEVANTSSVGPTCSPASPNNC